jgi:hypothetical protein
MSPREPRGAIHCAYCGDQIWYSGGVWVDATDGDACSGDATVLDGDKPLNENESHTPTRAEVSERRYSIVRFHRNGQWETLRFGLTLAEAQEWCQRDDTHGDGWFDGYREEEPTDD